MSLSLRVKYQYRSLLRLFTSWQLPSWVFSPVSKFCLLALVVMAGFGYITQINALSTSGYEIHTLEKQVAALSGENQKLESHLARLSSMNAIQARLQETDLVAVQQIAYLTSGKGSVAKR